MQPEQSRPKEYKATQQHQPQPIKRLSGVFLKNYQQALILPLPKTSHRKQYNLDGVL